MIGLTALPLLPGCGIGQKLNNAVDAFKAENPTVTLIPVDEDGDGANDFYGVDRDADHKVDTDPAGEPVEVPNTRAGFTALKASQAAAGDTDTAISELITVAGSLIGAAIGLPGIGLLGAWWGKKKPTKQIAQIVTNFQEARIEGGAAGYVKFSTDVLHQIKKEQPELYAVIRKIREAVPKAE